MSFDHCELLITDLILGDGLYTMRNDLNKKISEEEGRNILRKIIEGLADIHERGLTHRDLHLENMMICSKIIPPPTEEQLDDPVNYFLNELPHIKK